MLEQALFLLLDNAARHTPPGTAVRVKGFATDAQLILEVADEGPGIPAAEQPHIFERFVRGRHSSGMGLGLAICAAIAKAHGGAVALVAGRDRGAVFRLQLPRPTEQPSAPPADTGQPVGEEP